MKIINSTARLIALLSFLGGTVIFVWHYNSNQWFLVDYGACFILVAAFLNIVAIVVLIISALINREKRSYLLSIGLLLLNIPLALSYAYITYQCMNEAKHTFINGTKAEMTGIQICGCGSNTSIAKMKPGEKIKVRFKMDRPCSVYINFLSNEKKIELHAFGSDRPVELASWSTFIIEREVIYQIDKELLKKYDFP